MRQPRHRPVFTMPVAGWAVSVFVRSYRLPGQYEVDPGWQNEDDGALRRAPGVTRIVGRRAALRAAQHRARPADPPGRAGGRVPARPRRWRSHAPAVARVGPTLHGRNGNNSAAHYGNGTWLVLVASLTLDEGLFTWWEYVYRSRRAALRAYQGAGRYAPDGYCAAAYCTEDEDE